jgi:TfoX/Sxy family transcriptional regulator of competence genes
MAYDTNLAQRMRDHLANLQDLPGLEEKKMFGGVGFIIRGNMACGVHADYMIVRVGPENYQAALQQPFTRPFDMTGRPMAGWVEVAQPGCENASDLQAWIKKGIDFASSLPPK